MSVHIISELVAKAKANEFFRHVSALATGALLAQLIGFAASPILTRLYSPTDYAVLALFGAIVSSISAAACGRYDIAVVVAREDNDTRSLLSLSFWVATLISLFLFISLFMSEDLFRFFFKTELLGGWLLVVPFVLLMGSAGMALRFYANRYKDYSVISRISVYTAVASAALSMGFGLLNFQAQGLLLSTLLTTCFTLTLFVYQYRKDLVKLRFWPDSQLVTIAVRYRQFPVYNASTTLLDSVTLALPVFFIAKYFPEAIVGYYALLTRVATAPLGFISQAVSQVHIRKIAEQIHYGQDPTRYLASLSLILVGIISLPTILLMLTGPQLFAFVFGEAWRVAGELLVILMPALALKFVVSTVSGVFAGTGNNQLAALWKVCAFVGTLGMFWLFADKFDIRGIFYAMLITDLVLYLFYYYLIWYAVKYPKEII